VNKKTFHHAFFPSKATNKSPLGKGTKKLEGIIKLANLNHLTWDHYVPSDVPHKTIINVYKVLFDDESGKQDPAS